MQADIKMNPQELFKRRDIPYGAYTLILMNVALWLALRGSSADDVGSELGLVPDKSGLLQMFTSTFLHTHPLHLAGNMFFLWLFGRRVEEALGTVEFLLFYIASGFAASVLHLAMVWGFMPPEARQIPVLGASGSIAGVLGVFAIRFFRESFAFGQFRMPASIVLLAWLMVQVTMGYMALYSMSYTRGMASQNLPMVGYWAHLGGFIFGMGFAQISPLGLQARKEYLLNDFQESIRFGTLQEVARDFEELRRVDPDDPFAYAELGRTCAMMDEMEDAVPYYEKAVVLYLREGRVDLALQRFEEMWEACPHTLNDTRFLFRMGCLRDREGDHRGAIAVLKSLAAERPGTPEAEMAVLRVAEIYQSRLKDTEAAVKELRMFLTRWPDSKWRQFAEDSLGYALGNRPVRPGREDGPRRNV